MVLDEPTAGLDNFIRKDYHLTIVMITHQMSLVAKYATQVLVLNNGHLVANESPLKLFGNVNLLHKAGLNYLFKLNDLHWMYINLIVSKLKTGNYHE
ncbi:MAG: Hypothetical protein AJITA_00268 [Acetilactobacillus jinshanensis]